MCNIIICTDSRRIEVAIGIFEQMYGTVAMCGQEAERVRMLWGYSCTDVWILKWNF